MKINKFFFSKSFLEHITINKYLSRYEYPKFLIRSSLKSSPKAFLLDNYFELYEVTFKKYITSMRLRLLNLGNSVIRDIFFYKHRNLSFFLPGLGKKKQCTSIVNFLVKRLNSWSSHNHIVYIYRTHRGGYFGLSKGILGFIPKVYVLVFKNTFLKYRKYVLFYNFRGLKALDGHINLLNYSQVYIIKNFNKSSKKRRQLIFSKLKFILIQSKNLIKLWSKFFLKLNFNSISTKKLLLNLIFSKIINACL
jgi:hypothetical protein